MAEVFVGELVPGEQRDEVRAVFEELKDGAFPNRYENDWELPDGGRRPISWANTAITDEGGQVEYAIEP